MPGPWIEYHGGGRPVDGDTQVNVVYRSGGLDSGNAGRWRWHIGAIARYQIADVTQVGAMPLALLQLVERAFDCPRTNKPCNRSGCTVMHCEVHAKHLKDTPAKKPVPRQRRGTQGGFELGLNPDYVSATNPITGNRVVVARTSERSGSIDFPDNADERRCNAARIALLPELEQLALAVSDVYHAGGSPLNLSDVSRDLATRVRALI